jgi:hypothetical protein
MRTTPKQGAAGRLSHTSVHVIHNGETTGKVALWVLAGDGRWERKANLLLSSPCYEWDLDVLVAAIRTLLEEELTRCLGYQANLFE